MRSRFNLKRRRRDERGVMALLVALLSVCLVMAAAVAVDAAYRTDRQQNLVAGLDAAAQAGAYSLPNDTAGAKADALAFVKMHDSTETGSLAPNVDFWCIVASTGSSPNYTPDVTQIPFMCNPGAGPYTVARFPELRCGPTLCAIPCPVTQSCNTIRVSQARDVPFSFARAGGIDKGSTGSVSSVACKGPCGTMPPNPMDVAVVADRTGSMVVGGHDYTSDLITGVKGMLQVMTPSLHYVSLGTIGRSASTSHCANGGLTSPSSDPAVGSWMPVQFSSDYLTSTGTINTTSNLVKGLNCLTNHSGTGTHLASPLKSAARYVLGKDANNLASLPVRPGTPRKTIIFETDGAPNETISGGSSSLDVSGDIGATNSDAACTNFKTVAANAKAAGVTVVTVAFNASTAKCGGTSSSAKLVDTMAAAASPDSNGAPSAADNNCSTTPGRTAENSDGDNFFCAAPGDALAPIFKTAFGQASGSIRLINLP